ncbi:asparagine synthase (glutamine-hydrolyzing) [Hydrogenophaga sp. MI9]|uniref:asparagine synthase (glutamine-hydrolyzing) n=1 Tax=Hydrogenophaga sp. MI9 TaxID=3453719 RepID=UPI003EEFDF5F
MSGIAGIVHFDGRPVAPGLIEGMTAAMAFRGPDGIDHWTSGPVALGHCQLHTTPESLEEQQPVISADGQRVLVFDGRLDNWVELRQELLRRGARLRNRSDAELALHAFEVWGDACVEHLDGDFALALWDQASQTLFAARDRTGNRALHYHWADSRLSFSTDVHALFELPHVPKELDLDTVAEYLAIEWMSLERTLWAGISMLKPAHAMRVGAGTLKTWCYWMPTLDMDLGCRTAQDYADAYRSLLDDVVRRQSRALGPLAIEVSGGLDSSAIFASAARLHQRGALLAPGIDGYTLGFRGDALADEVDLALAVGRHLGHDIEVVPPTRMPLQEYLQDMQRFKTFPDMPNGSMGRSIGEAAVRKHSRVLLSGTGGDEWLGGESAYFAEAIQAGRCRDLLRFMRDEQSRHGTARALWAPIRHGLLPLLPDGIRFSLRDLANRLTDPTLSSPWLSADMTARLGRLRALERSQESPRFSRTGQRRQWNNLWNPYVIAAKQWNERRMARLGLEWRQPFWDPRLIQFCFAVPEEFRMHQGTNKWFHRLAFQDDLPAVVRERQDKAEFSVAYQHLWPDLKQRFHATTLPRSADWISARFLLEVMDNATNPERRVWGHGIVWCLFATDALRYPESANNT